MVFDTVYSWKSQLLFIGIRRRHVRVVVLDSLIDANAKMASTDVDRCTNYPDFAVICSFVDKFGETLSPNLPNIGELQTALESTDEGNI